MPSSTSRLVSGVARAGFSLIRHAIGEHSGDGDGDDARHDERERVGQCCVQRKARGVTQLNLDILRV